MLKSYTELISLPTYEERFRYLSLGGRVGADTFGCHRYLNQVLYGSKEWRAFRRDIIVRDNGCDLAHPDYQIANGVKVLIHHINPLTIEDIVNRSSKIFDPENVITTVFDTHQAIHYGDEKLLSFTKIIDRKPNDTCPWR